jgi:uncharacterized phage protein (TIGR02218 family)
VNYLARQIFPFAPNWADAVSRDITFDQRETLLGFGAEFFTPTAEFTVNGWDFSLYLQDGSDFIAWESFCDSLVGRLNGFWLPCPLNAAEFSAAISTTQFKIKTEGLADTWQSRPDQHLLFTFPDGTQSAGQISGVVDNGDGTETVTMTAPLAEAPAAGTVITRLHYVRMAGDEEAYQFDGENIGSIKVTVLELPLEYTDAETGLQPVYLYAFRADAPVATFWNYTSFAAGVVSGGKLFAPFAMSHKSIKHTVDGNSNQLEIEAKPDANHPFSMLAGVPPGRPLWIDIFLCYYATPDNATKIFSGYVSSVTDDGIKYTAKCDTRMAWLKTKLPRFLIGSTCNWVLFEPNTCKAQRAIFETTVTISAFVAGAVPIVQATFNFAFQFATWIKQDWFTGGILETGVGVKYELRSIIASKWNASAGVIELTLNIPLKFAVAGQQMQVTAGCDHTSNGANGCIQKFNNYKNFGGFVAVPERNLSLVAIQNTVASGGKK